MATYTIAAGTDDAVESAGGNPQLTDTAIIFNQVNTVGGHRFTNVNIPKGATIISATLGLRITDSSKNDAEGTWFGQAADNPGTFTTTNGDVDARARTTASVAWTANDLGNAGTTINSPSLVSIVQEIVNRAGWTPGNAMVFFYVHNSTTDKIAWAAVEDASAPEATFTVTFTVALGQAVERDRAFLAAVTKSVLPGTATEQDLANALSVVRMAALSQATEQDVASPLGVLRTVGLGSAIEQDVASTLTAAKTIALQTAIEQEGATALTTAKVVSLQSAVARELAGGMAGNKVVELQDAVERDTASGLTYGRVIELISAIEQDTATGLMVSKIVDITDAVEQDIAQALSAVIGDGSPIPGTIGEVQVPLRVEAQSTVQTLLIPPMETGLWI